MPNQEPQATRPFAGAAERDVPRKRNVRVLALNRLSATGYELVCERDNLQFKAGQLVNIHGANHFEDRSYTICSGVADATLTILFTLIPAGILTPRLSRLSPGDMVTLSGPYGEFTIRDPSRPLVFFASGTGVAPCRAYLRSYDHLEMTLVHGVRHRDDLFYRSEFSRLQYFPCVSRDPDSSDVFHGRVTEFAHRHDFPASCHFYLCGANEMIYSVREILESRGVDRTAIFTEEYYYRADD